MNLVQLQAHIQAVDTLDRPDPGYFHKLIEEVGELAEAIRQDKGGQPSLSELKGSIAEELVDVLYYVAALANLYQVDLSTSFDLKEQLNKIKYGR